MIQANTMNTTPDKPPRFEDEYPEEAGVLMQLCANKKLREMIQWKQSSLPKSERVYPYVNDLQLGILGWKYTMFSNTKTDTYKRSEPKIGRNDLCPCGSGKKYKKCCIIEK